MMTWLLWLAVVLAQEVPLPVPLSALSLDASTSCPDVPEDHVPGLVATSVGPATHRGDGSYTWICPSLWGGEARPRLASDATGGTLVVVTGGEVYRSEDRGCSFSLVPLIRGSLEAVEVLFWRDGFWVIAQDQGTQSTEVMQLGPGGLESFVAIQGLLADSAAPGVGALWMAGLQPQPAAVRVNLAGGLSGADELLTDLPSGDRITGLSIPGAADDEVWIQVERGINKGLWHGRRLETEVVLWEAKEGSWRSLLGPVLYDGLWLASLEGALHTAGRRSGNLEPVGSQVAWTHLRRVGDRLFAGTATRLMAITGFDAELNPFQEEVFAMSQLARPVEVCRLPGCDEQLDEIAAAGSFDPDLPAVCPDGRTLADLEEQECTCNGGGLGGGGWLALAAWMLARRRWRREVS